jgi:hypothetical protein
MRPPRVSTRFRSLPDRVEPDAASGRCEAHRGKAQRAHSRERSVGRHFKQGRSQLPTMAILAVISFAIGAVVGKSWRMFAAKSRLERKHNARLPERASEGRSTEAGRPQHGAPVTAAVALISFAIGLYQITVSDPVSGPWIRSTATSVASSISESRSICSPGDTACEAEKRAAEEAELIGMLLFP